MGLRPRFETPTKNGIPDRMSDCACDLTAIPAAERPAHVALARSLLAGDPPAARATADGYVVDVPAGRLPELVRFVENERRCCAHLAFSLEVPPRGGPVRLDVRGPGAREALEALAEGPRGGGAERPR